MTNCRSAIERLARIPQIGGPPMVHSEVHCGLKLQGEHEKISVYQRLFEAGLEGSMMTTICPAAAGGRWSFCPFREQE